MKAPAVQWWPEPDAGDIVWCQFPHLPQLVPGPKPRPALVLDVTETTIGSIRVTVAYGTSKKLSPLRAGEFVISRSDGSAFKLAGLGFDTKFSLRDSVQLDFNSDWFKPPPIAPFGQSPKLGLLHPALATRAAAAWKAANQ